MKGRSRIVFFGTTNELSLAAMETTRSGNIDVLAVIVDVAATNSSRMAPLERLFPAVPSGDLRIVNPYHEPNLIHAAWSADIPVYAASRLGSAELAQLLTKLSPDAAFVSCFPQRLPGDLMSSVPLGFFNVHPSLLPHYRGPAPLFWLFQRDDNQRRGVTVHQMDEGLDTGPIVCQERLTFADGLKQRTIEQQCGHSGGKLLLRALSMLASGGEASPQPPGGSYLPWPKPADYILEPAWSARRAFNFMRASDGSGATYPLRMPGLNLKCVEALGYSPEGRQEFPVAISGLTARIQFTPGILEARVSPLS